MALRIMSLTNKDSSVLNLGFQTLVNDSISIKNITEFSLQSVLYSSSFVDNLIKAILCFHDVEHPKISQYAPDWNILKHEKQITVTISNYCSRKKDLSNVFPILYIFLGFIYDDFNSEVTTSIVPNATLQYKRPRQACISRLIFALTTMVFTLYIQYSSNLNVAWRVKI